MKKMVRTWLKTQVRSEPRHTELVRIRLLPSCSLRGSEEAGLLGRDFGKFWWDRNMSKPGKELRLPLTRT